MFFCNNLYLFYWEMSKYGIKFMWRLSNSNALTSFIILAIPHYVYQSIHLNAFKLVNTSFYSLNNKKEILNGWKKRQINMFFDTMLNFFSKKDRIYSKNT